jgi:hypothetical protein
MQSAFLIDLAAAQRVVEQLARDEVLDRGASERLNVSVFVNCHRIAESEADCKWRATGYRVSEPIDPVASLTCAGETRVSVVGGILRPRGIRAIHRMCSE